MVNTAETSHSKAISGLDCTSLTYENGFEMRSNALSRCVKVGFGIQLQMNLIGVRVILFVSGHVRLINVPAIRELQNLPLSPYWWSNNNCLRMFLGIP